MIVVDNLVKQYGDRVAVDGVSFEVEKGQILGFLGPNGAGKTTTMRILTCFLPATAGKVSIAGHDVFDESHEVRKRIGYLPENVPLYHDMTVEGYLSYMGRLKGMDKSALGTRLGEVIESCGLTERRRDIIGKLSRGYRQRVGLAQALVHDPDVLILDEPTASLDPVQIRDVRDYIRSLAGNHTIVLSTHILPEVELICDRVLVINRGRLVADDSPQNLRRMALAGKMVIEVEAVGDAAQLTSAVRGLDGVGAVTSEPVAGHHRLRVETEGDIRREVAHAVVTGGFGLLRLDTATQSLEDIFVALTTEEATTPAEAA